jgi:twitching motility two-component system response regulator PilH
MRKIYGKRFEAAGYEISTAADGEDAQLKALELPDLIILDIVMPKLNGYEACVKLKQNPATKQIPVIMFTSKGHPREQPSGLPLGADVYVSKSCRTEVLLEHIKLILSKKV